MRVRFAILWLLAGLWPPMAAAVEVDPTGVNVRQTGATSVFLTFRDLRADQVPEEGIWCGAIDPVTSECLPPFFGQLPARSDLSRRSAAGANLTDIMTIPPSVSRRAVQDARGSGDGEFFYVRRFSSTAALPDEFVAVSCRLAGGGARSPLALLDVDVRFEIDRPVLFVPRHTSPSPLRAEISYNGTGRLRGRWEIVLPGDPQPEAFDLLPQASLPVELRGTQRRYTLLRRFDVFLPPTGRITLPGPDPASLPHEADGLHLILLRLEASDERESLSDTGSGIAGSGGVAGFALPPLRYYVGSGEDGPALSTLAAAERIVLLAPRSDARLEPGARLNFGWLEIAGAAAYSIEVENADGPVFRALIDRAVQSYTAPPWMRSRAAGALRWRVVAHGPDTTPLARSEWRELHLSP